MNDFRVNLKGISQDWQTGKWNITFEVMEGNLQALKDIAQKALRLTIKEWREKRSKDANAYYWELIGKLAEVHNTSTAFQHNRMLRQYGQLEEVDGYTVEITIPDTEEAENKALEAFEFHIRPTSKIETKFRDGKIETFRVYQILRGSHTYDSKEMSILIDGLVSECKDSKIETLPPHELERMISEWKA